MAKSGKKTSLAPSIDEQLRAAILASEQIPSVIADAAGVDRGVVSRFLSGERDLRLATAARLARELGLELRQAR